MNPYFVCIFVKPYLSTSFAMKHKLIVWGAFLGGTGVALGALGAHALKTRLNADSLSSFETGVRYQIIHALLLLLLASLSDKLDQKPLKLIGNGIITGTLMFSCSIYLLSTMSLFGMEFLRYLGPITPIGGILLISSWFYLMWVGIKYGKAD